MILLRSKNTWFPGGAHLKVLLNEGSPFAQVLHDGFVPQNVLLTKVLSALSRLQRKTVY